MADRRPRAVACDARHAGRAEQGCRAGRSAEKREPWGERACPAPSPPCSKTAVAPLRPLLKAAIAGYQSALFACRDPRGSELAPGRTVSPDEGRFGAALRE